MSHYLTNVFAGGEVFIEFIRYSALIVRDHIIFISIIIREQGRNITSLLHYCSKNWIMYYNCWCVIVRYQKSTMLDAISSSILNETKINAFLTDHMMKSYSMMAIRCIIMLTCPYYSTYCQWKVFRFNTQTNIFKSSIENGHSWRFETIKFNSSL